MALNARLGSRFLENSLVFFPYENLQLVYPPLWHGPFDENPYAKLRLGRSEVLPLRDPGQHPSLKNPVQKPGQRFAPKILEGRLSTGGEGHTEKS